MSNNIKPLDKMFNGSIKFLLLSWFVLSSTLTYFQVPAQFHSVATDILTGFVIFFCITISFVLIKRIVLNVLNQSVAKKGISELTDLGFSLPDSIYNNKKKNSVNLTLYHTLYSSYEKYLFTSQFEEVLTKQPDEELIDPDLTLAPNTAKTPKELYKEANSKSSEDSGDNIQNVTIDDDSDIISNEVVTGDESLVSEGTDESDSEQQDSVIVTDGTEVEK